MAAASHEEYSTQPTLALRYIPKQLAGQGLGRPLEAPPILFCLLVVNPNLVSWSQLYEVEKTEGTWVLFISITALARQFSAAHIALPGLPAMHNRSPPSQDRPLKFTLRAAFV